MVTLYITTLFLKYGIKITLTACFKGLSCKMKSCEVCGTLMLRSRHTEICQPEEFSISGHCRFMKNGTLAKEKVMRNS